MKHVDEGTLQRWLDGERGGLVPEEREAVEAHLDACPECAARLEELEARGRRAEELLAVPLGDDEAVPDFEEVRARARGGAPTAARRPRWRPAAWAASIAVALGVGWMANELQRSAPVAGPVPEAEVAPRPAAPLARAAPGDVQPTESGEDGPAGVRAERTAIRADEVVAGDVADTTGELAGAEIPVPSEPRADLAPLARPASPIIASAPVEELPARAPAVLRGRVIDEEGRPLDQAVVTVAEAGVGTLTEADGSFELALADLPTDSGPVSLRAERIGYAPASEAVDVGAGAPAELRLSRQALSLDEMVVTGAARAADPTWRAVPRAEAEAEAGFPVQAVPGLPVVSVEVGRVGGSVLVRVLQELDGGTLELILGRAGDDAALMAAGAATGEGGVVQARRGDVVVRARAPLPVEELEALLRRIPRGP